MSKDKSTPALIKKDGKKTVYQCGKNAKAKAEAINKEAAPTEAEDKKEGGK